MSSLGRGGLMFILVIWLQGIWLPEHGYSFARTPLWPASLWCPDPGFPDLGSGVGLLVGPIWFTAVRRHRHAHGRHEFPAHGTAAHQFLLQVVRAPAARQRARHGSLRVANRAAVMNSLPPDQRGQGSGMGATTMNAAMVLSMGIFFTLIIVGIAGSLPSALYNGLTANGVPAAAARQVSNLPPTSSVFAAFLGYNPIKNCWALGRARPPVARPSSVPDRPVLLPEPHHRTLQARPARGARLRRDLLPAGGARGVDHGQAVFLQGPEAVVAANVPRHRH